MGTITIYSFEDTAGAPETYTTQDYAAAKEFAARHGLRIVGQEFEWAQSVPLDDFTGTEDEETARALGEPAWLAELIGLCGGARG